MSQPTLSRRTLIVGAAGVAGVAVVGAAGIALAPERIRTRLGLGREPYIPDAPEGQVRLEQVDSSARGQAVDLFTAVPDGYGDGAGLPVVVILHGASATAEDFQSFGLGRFLTQAVRDGAAPFVLAGTDGGRAGWEGADDDDPLAMLADELPQWLADRGFDAERRALWGWSMGGYGALRMAQTQPDYARAVATFSPAVRSSDAVFADVDALAGLPLAIWCGTDDAFFADVEDLVSDLPDEPEIASFDQGEAHTRAYWNDHTLEAFGFLSRHLQES